MSFRSATAAQYSGCCRCQNNLDYLYQMLNGWLLGKTGYEMKTYNNLASVLSSPGPHEDELTLFSACARKRSTSFASAQSSTLANSRPRVSSIYFAAHQARLIVSLPLISPLLLRPSSFVPTLPRASLAVVVPLAGQSILVHRPLGVERSGFSILSWRTLFARCTGEWRACCVVAPSERGEPLSTTRARAACSPSQVRQFRAVRLLSFISFPAFHFPQSSSPASAPPPSASPPPASTSPLQPLSSSSPTP